MIIALLLCVTLTSLTGWLYTTDTFRGSDWMEDFHDTFANCLVPLIVLHVASVIFASIRQRENLERSMIHGQKDMRPGDQ